MAKELYQVSSPPRILVTECAGDLVIRPWLNLDVKAKGTYEAKETDGQLIFSSNEDLVLHVPEDSNIHIQSVAGDCVVRSLTGDTSVDEVSGDAVFNNLFLLKVGQVHGDVVASNISGQLTVHKIDGDAAARNIDQDLSLGLVSGDVSAKNIAGSLSIDEVSGDVGVRNVGGDVSINRVHRDVNLRNLAGRCQVGEVAGDVRLKGGLGPYDHALSATGDIVVSWPVEEPLLLEAEASKIDNRLPLLDVTKSDGQLSGRLGDGKTRLTLKAGGRVVLKEAQIVSKKWESGAESEFEFDFVSDLAGLGARISTEVEEQVAQVTAELQSNFGPDFMQRMADQFSKKADKASKKAAKAAEKATEKAQRASERAAARAAERRQASPDGLKSQPRDTSEAQLKILKMVETGVISPDEASMLLEALEGD